MAGNYPDVPDLRMAYDRDGSIGIMHATGDSGVTTLTLTDKQNMNDENVFSNYNPGLGATNGMVGVIFPELRDVSAYYIAVGGGVVSSDHIWTSVDTTNGFDGTWVDQGSYTADGSTLDNPHYRTSIVTLGSVLTGIKAIKFQGGHPSNGFSITTLHLYGKISSGQTPDRLRLWHPTLNQEVDGAYFDWGNVPQGTTQDRTFRIKNNSGTLTANDVTVSIDSLTALSVPDVHTLSKDGSTFTSTINFTSIAPGVITAVCTLRRVTPSNASLSIAVMRIKATASNWT